VTKAEKSEMNRFQRELDESGQGRNGVLSVFRKTESKGANMMSQALEKLDKGQGNIDNIIKMASSGKEFSYVQLLSMQATMYKYTQELDLTSKVVEKATSGLKDTLKTQV